MSLVEKAAAVGGICGPAVFAGVVAALSFLEQDFMRSLGWDPVTSATRDWPSGLALGRFGVVMTAAFVVCGLLLALFALGFRRGLRASRVGSAAATLLVVAGFAMCLLAFSTDPTNSAAPATFHGRIHDAAFVLLGGALMPSLALFGISYQGGGKRSMAVLSWVTAALILPSFAAKGVTFYLFLAGFLAWSEAAAVQLLRSGRGGGAGSRR